jgi:hypothetical protein
MRSHEALQGIMSPYKALEGGFKTPYKSLEALISPSKTLKGLIGFLRP